jgi:hypothetical protein
MAAPPPGYPMVNSNNAAGPSSGYPPTMPVHADPRGAPVATGGDEKAAAAALAAQQGGVAAGTPVQGAQVYPPQQPQAYVDPSTGQTVYYAANGQAYYAGQQQQGQGQQVYPPPANPYAPNPYGQQQPYMAAYPGQQQQQQQYYAQQQQPGGGGAGGAGAGLCAGLLGGLLACCCLDMMF